MSLPNTYRKLDCINNVGGWQYIDTGVLFGNNKYDFNISFIELPSETNRYIFGTTQTDQQQALFYQPANNTLRYRAFTSSNYGAFTPIINKKYHIVLDFAQGNQSMTIDGVVNAVSTNTGTYDTSRNAQIFFGNSTVSNNKAIYNLYDWKIYSNNVLVRYFIPAQRISDKEIGLYDLVNDVFYTNQGTGKFYYENIILEDNPLITTLENDLSLQANFKIRYNITLIYDETLGTASYSWGEGNTVNLSASVFDNAQFKGWYIGDTKISSNLNTTYEVTGDTTFEARFTPKYTIELDYDSSLGSASFTRDTSEQNIIYLSVDSTVTQFNGWYINDELISYNQQAQYQITEDSIIEARFEPIWEIDDSVEGDGSIQYSRQETNLNIVTFTVIPNANRHFVKYVIDGVDEFETPITLTLTNNLTIVAYFEEDDKYHITASANIKNTSVYISHNDDYAGYTATLWARPFPNYVFTQWSDGNTENPRTIVVSEDVTLVAEFNHVIETNGIYQYRCFVKDQLNLTDKPKAFMVVDKFTLKQDYLTNANSTIEVLKMANDVNNGDVIVVYNPKGETIYQGVITSISDNKITTSQMQSFYKGMWIYNNYASAQYVEEEVAYLLEQYAQGKVYGSTYVDPLVAERLGGITIRNTNSISGKLPTDLDKDGNEQYTQWDMEKFIYKLYQDYGIVFEFTINMVGDNYVDIKVPTYQSLSIGNNHYAIMNLSPMQTIEENNKLIIYWNSTVQGQHQAKQYRTTYVATKNGIVEEPSSMANRFNITNTTVVFSDDDVADLVAANLPNTMYNHKITFDLLLKNNLYQFGEFKLGMPLTIWYNGIDYYDSVLTGRTFTKQSNQNVSIVSYTCGLVRTTLTKKLTLNRA